MVGLGSYFRKHAPGEINMVFGYRTSMSMKNRDTWEFAHSLIGKIWYRAGLLLIPCSVIPLFFVMGKGEDPVGNLGGIICGVQIFVLIGSIVPVERALKRTFDKNGNLRK